MKCYLSGTICKITNFETQIATFGGIIEKLLLFELKLKLLHLWEYLKNCYFFTETAGSGM